MMGVNLTEHSVRVCSLILLPCALRVDTSIRKRREEKTTPFGRQFDEKPSIMLGCSCHKHHSVSVLWTPVAL